MKIRHIRVGNMEIKPLHIVIALAVVFLALFTVSQIMAPKPEVLNYTSPAEALYMVGASAGENASAYTYAYSEYSNGFQENYTLESDGNVSSVEVASVLSDMKLYFLKNDTILCVKFVADQACSSVKNETAATSYVASMRNRLFNSAAINSMKTNYAYMANKSILVFSPDLQPTILPDGRKCTQITYTIDYRNMTLQDMSRFGVSAGTPQVFQFVSCVGNDGYIDQLYFNYTYQGNLYTVQQKLISADFGTVPAISPPQNLSGDAMGIAFNENSYKDALFQCYLSQPEGAGRGACIQKIALQLSDKDLCDAAGAMRDQCLVSFMPYVKDPAVCKTITAPEFVDDCYIELAGAYKNSTWCDMVNDSTKKAYCMQVALPLPPPAQENQSQGTPGGGLIAQNVSGNESAVPPGVVNIFNEIDSGNSTGNSTISANTTG